MAIFALKKYSDKEIEPTKEEGQVDSVKEADNKEVQNVNSSGVDVPKEKESINEDSLQIEISGSVSGLVALALQKVLSDKNVRMEVEDSDEEVKEVKSSIKAITSEDINSDPVKAFKSISKSDVVYIQTEGFNTAQEEWFLTNLPNKTDNVFYSVESAVNYLSASLEELDKVAKDIDTSEIDEIEVPSDPDDL